jgi:hypothetical protein
VLGVASIEDEDIPEGPSASPPTGAHGAGLEGGGMWDCILSPTAGLRVCPLAVRREHCRAPEGVSGRCGPAPFIRRAG